MIEAVCPRSHRCRQTAITGLLFFVMSLFALTAHADSKLRPSKAGWEYLETKGEVKLYRKTIKNSDLFVVRGVTTIRQPIGKVARVIDDYTQWVKWAEMLQKVKLLEVHSDGSKTVYQAFDMPFVLSDRDLVYRYGMKPIPSGVLIEGKSVRHKKSPSTVGERMQLSFGRWFLTRTKRNHTRVTLEVLMDPKGVLPAWFINIAQRDYPFNTLTGLRRQAAKKSISPLPIPPYKTHAAKP